MLRLLPLLLLCLLSLKAAPLDRQAIVARHKIHVQSLDPEAALSVGSGDFAFTVDATGLQSFDTLYYEKGLPLETLCDWAWHAYPNPQGLRLEDTMENISFHGRSIAYATRQNTPAGTYYRENPHPLPLGQLGFFYKGAPLAPEQVSDINQDLDLWTGIIRSHFKLDGQPVDVETVAHPAQSTLGLRVQSPLLSTGALQLRLRFPYGHDLSKGNKPPLRWDLPDRHESVLTQPDTRLARISRTLDDSHYCTELSWTGELQVREATPHTFLVSATSDSLNLACAFTPEGQQTRPSFEFIRAASIEAWKQHWLKGGLADFSGSKDPRATELERRIVLSLYLVKVNYAGSMPPAETGLTHLSWFGKHNSEVYFWHAAQFYQWGHTELLEKGLAWYLHILPKARAVAEAEGYKGAHWPKMAGPEGRPTPGTINPFIIWNQPNPIYLCELVYRANPSRATLEHYAPLVFNSAEFLASYAALDPQTRHYVLGPPLKNVSESSNPAETRNPCFELAFWRYGLELAQAWRNRLGLPPEPEWAEILNRLSPLPTRDGLYLELETEPDLYSRKGRLPVSMLLSYGYLPRTAGLDVETFRKTFAEVNRRNGLENWVSWSLGQGALAAARLGEPNTAVAILTNSAPAARFMPSGHVRRPKEPTRCVSYLPVNASLLCAAGLMIAGWDEAPPGDCPGFPKDGSWNIRWEGLNPLP